MNQNENMNAYHSKYIPSIIKWGRATNLVGVLIAFLPGLTCTFIYGLRPEITAVIGGFVLVASSEAVFWIVEPVSYFPTLGIPGTYMSFLSGNISNLRLPVSLAAQTSAEVEPGTEKGNVITAIGVGVSVIVNIIVLTVGVLLGSSILSLIPAGVISALTNIVPALFGALFAQNVVSRPKTGVVAIVLACGIMLLNKFGLLGWVPGDPTYVIMIVCVFGTILIGKKLETADMKKGEAK